MVNLIQFQKDLDRDLKRRFGKNIETWVWSERGGDLPLTALPLFKLELPPMEMPPF